MAWDFDTQFMTQDSACMTEYGTLTLGALGTKECTTRLRVIHSAIAIHKAAESGNLLAASTIYCDGTITSGAVTFTDPAGAVNASATFFYILRGLG